MVADLISDYRDSELVIGLVGAVGAQLDKVSVYLKNKLDGCGYIVHEIRVSTQVIPMFVDTSHVPDESGYERTSELMKAGNQARENADDNSILALGVATRIHRLRELDDEEKPKPKERTAYIIRSLKRPEEVKRLQDIYGSGFYLIAAHNDYEKRFQRLTGYLNIDEEEAIDLIERDFEEKDEYGQRLNKTFSLADFFIRIDADQGDAEVHTEREVERIVRIIFGHPFTTPTFDEYAMYFAFVAALRSGDLSRQVGAVVARDNQILSHGANDCPKFDGGLYWPERTNDGIIETEDGRDFMRSKTVNGTEHIGFDSNEVERNEIINGIIENVPEEQRDFLKGVLESSSISDITEYGRVVHAEMEALLSCGRAGVSPKSSTLYSTTFPCHNCAKHIVAAGVHRVVYIEPYPKSKALEFHDDSIYLGFQEQKDKVHFEPFVGVGPRRFFDLFSSRHGSGRDIERKKDGFAVEWADDSASLRLQLSPFSYLDLEELARDRIKDIELNEGELGDE